MLQDIFNQQISFLHGYNPTGDDLIFHNYHHFQEPNLSESLHEVEHKLMQTHNISKQTMSEANQEPQNQMKQKKQKKKRIRKYISNNPDNKKGHWTKEQNLRYHIFLELNSKYFIDSERRKIDKIFKSMSNFIETRQAHQCRSHHQKIEKKWGSFCHILLNLRKQNFTNTKKKFIVQAIENLEIENYEIYEDYQLLNQQQLLLRVINECKSTQKGQDSQQFQDNQQISCYQGSLSNRNCMCLMMSQKYEDQLSF